MKLNLFCPRTVGHFQTACRKASLGQGDANSFFQAKGDKGDNDEKSKTWMLKIENRENIDEFQPKFVIEHSWVKEIQVYLNKKSHPLHRENTFTIFFKSPNQYYGI